MTIYKELSKGDVEEYGLLIEDIFGEQDCNKFKIENSEGLKKIVKEDLRKGIFIFFKSLNEEEIRDQVDFFECADINSYPFSDKRTRNSRIAWEEKY